MEFTVEETSELLKAHIWNHLFNFINSMSGRHPQPMTLNELVAALPINKAKAPCVYRLMRILVHSGFFLKVKVPKNIQEKEKEEEEEAYLPTTSSRLLLKNEPISARPFFVAMVDPILVSPWHYLGEWFKKGDSTPFTKAHGKTLWDYAGHDPHFNQLFNDGMASDARLIASLLVKECKGVFEGINSLVDVGGGTGTAAMAVADAFPHLSCTVLDLANLQGRGNLSYVGGSLFEAIPRGDAVLLKERD